MKHPYYEGPRHALVQTAAQNRVEVLAVLRVMPGLSDSARQALIALITSEAVAVFRHQETGEWMIWQRADVGAVYVPQSLAWWYAQWYEHQQHTSMPDGLHAQAPNVVISE